MVRVPPAELLEPAELDIELELRLLAALEELLAALLLARLEALEIELLADTTELVLEAAELALDAPELEVLAAELAAPLELEEPEGALLDGMLDPIPGVALSPPPPPHAASAAKGSMRHTFCRAARRLPFVLITIFVSPF